MVPRWSVGRVEYMATHQTHSVRVSVVPFRASHGGPSNETAPGQSRLFRRESGSAGSGSVVGDDFAVGASRACRAIFLAFLSGFVLIEINDVRVKQTGRHEHG